MPTTNKHGMPIIGNHTQRPDHRRRITTAKVVTPETRPTDDWTYTIDEVITDAFIELGINPKAASVIPTGSSINTRPGVPSIPTFKGVRFLGTLPFHKRVSIRLRNFGHAILKTGVYAK